MNARRRALFLPCDHPRAGWALAAFSFAVFVITGARDVGMYDGGELAAVACQPGLGHPIGQPLHTLFGFVFCQLPGSSILGLVILSALPAALTVLCSYSLAQTLAGPIAGRHSSRAAAAVAAGLMGALSLHAAYWEPSTRVEVYALAWLPAVWAIARLAAALRKKGPVASRDLALVAVAVGLSVCANAVIGMIAAVSLLVAAGPALVRGARRPPHRASSIPLRAVPRTLGAGLLGLLPMSWIPLSPYVTSDNAIVWGDPTSLERLSFYLRGADYARNQRTSPSMLSEHIGSWLSDSLMDGALPWLLIGSLSALLLVRRAGAIAAVPAVSSALAILFVCANTIFHPDVLDYAGYLLGGWIVAGAGCAAICLRLSASRRGLAISATMAIAALASAIVSPPGVFERTRHEDRALSRLVTGALHEAPPGAIILVEADHWVAPLWYVQEVEGVRPDVVVLPVGLTSSSWLWDHVYQLHPGLAPIELAGPGGQLGRVDRFLDANSERPLGSQNAFLAAQLGRRTHCVGYLVWTGSTCPDDARAEIASRDLEQMLAELEDRSPATHEALASVSVDRGEALFRMGRGRDAIDAFLAGVLPAQRGAELNAVDDEVMPLAGPLPGWSEHAAVGDGRRSLFLAAQVHLAAGDPQSANALLLLAANAGLPEARARLE